MNEIKVGDYVRVVREYPACSGSLDGEFGIVTELRSSLDYPYRIQLSGSNVEDIVHDVKLVMKNSVKKTGKYPVIVITTDGKTTTAVKRVGKAVVGKSTSVCSDNDEFDFDVGAAVAFSRLVGGKYHVEEKPKHYTGKVVCLESWCNRWTPGKCYEVVNGIITDDCSLSRTRTATAYTFEEFYDLWVGKYDNGEARFAEVVERNG